jgi:plastocyanin
MTASGAFMAVGSRPLVGRFTPLAAVAAMGLTVVALGYIYLFTVLIGEISPDMAIVPIAWSVALLPLTGKRWASIPTVLIALAGFAFEFPFIFSWHLNEYDVARPFTLNVLVLPAAYLVTIAAGIGATFQNYRRAPADRTMPRWALPALTIVTSLVVGGALVAFTPKHGVVARVSDEAVESLPVAIAMGNDQFLQQEMRVKAGEVVQWRVLNADRYDHTFDIDALGIHATVPGAESAFIMFKPEKAGRYVYDCAIPGHNMSGLLIVE